MKICATPNFFAQKIEHAYAFGVEVTSSSKKTLCSKLM
jgi:hypothetical protein